MLYLIDEHYSLELFLLLSVKGKLPSHFVPSHQPHLIQRHPIQPIPSSPIPPYYLTQHHLTSHHITSHPISDRVPAVCVRQCRSRKTPGSSRRSGGRPDWTTLPPRCGELVDSSLSLPLVRGPGARRASSRETALRQR